LGCIPGCFFDLLWGEQRWASFVRVGEELPTAPAPAPWRQEGWAEKIETAVKNGADYLLSVQAEEGYWHGELEADTTLESDYIYYLHVLGKAEPARIAKLANYVRQKQMADGGWPILSEWAFRTERHLQSLLRTEAGRRFAGIGAPGEGARGSTSAGRAEHTNSYVRFIWRWWARWDGSWFLRFRRS